MKKQWNLNEKIEAAAAAVLLAAGLASILYPVLSADLLMVIVGVVCTISGLLLLWQAWRNRRGMDVIKAVIALLMAVLFWSHRYSGDLFVARIFGLYMAGTGLILLIEGIMDLHQKARVGWAFCALALGAFVLAGFGLATTAAKEKLAPTLIGWYLIYQAVQLVVELIVFRSHRSSRAFSFRYWTSLPVYIVSAGPSILLRYVEKHRLESVVFPDAQIKNSSPVNLRVYVHTGLSGDQQFGHMTFSYKGVMFSYGNYDAASEKLFRSYGPAILFTAPAEIYVNNCCLIEHSTLFEYGLHLTDEQEQHLQAYMHQIFKGTYRWYCPLAQQPLTHERFRQFESDYSSRLFWRTGAKFYKFYHGQWKNYWVFGTNCSLFASSVLHAIDRNVAIPPGINTPGEYFQYFEQAYQDPSSNVVYKSWHTASRPETLYPTAL